MEDKYIKGSPFSVTVSSPADKLSTTICGVKQPMGVAVNQRGEVVLTEGGRGRNCVTVFSPNGERLRSFSFNGLPNGLALDNEGDVFVTRNYYPRGVAFNASNNKVYVVSGSHIQILNSDLSTYSTFGKYNSGLGQFDRPEHIACDGIGNIYVADWGTNHIQVFTADGEFLRAFTAGVERWHPFGVAVGSRGIVYVSEYWSH